MYANFSDEFKKQMKKIKDKATLKKLETAIKNIIKNPKKGKFLTQNLKGKKSAKIKPFRIIFAVKIESIEFHTFEHRQKAYKK